MKKIVNNNPIDSRVQYSTIQSGHSGCDWLETNTKVGQKLFKRKKNPMRATAQVIRRAASNLASHTDRTILYVVYEFNAFTTGKRFFTNLLEISIGRDWGALKRVKSIIVYSLSLFFFMYIPHLTSNLC